MSARAISRPARTPHRLLDGGGSSSDAVTAAGVRERGCGIGNVGPAVTGRAQRQLQHPEDMVLADDAVGEDGAETLGVPAASADGDLADTGAGRRARGSLGVRSARSYERGRPATNPPCLRPSDPLTVGSLRYRSCWMTIGACASGRRCTWWPHSPRDPLSASCTAANRPRSRRRHRSVAHSPLITAMCQLLVPTGTLKL